MAQVVESGCRQQRRMQDFTGLAVDQPPAQMSHKIVCVATRPVTTPPTEVDSRSTALCGLKLGNRVAVRRQPCVEQR
jgi:hypothetical protein